MGKPDHELYNTWCQIKQRCLNPTSPDYKDYGGVGVTLYQEWRSSFEAFAFWIETNLGPRPTGRTSNNHPLYTLDRFPNPYGNYEPGNIRWATQTEQMNNRRWYRRSGESLKVLMLKRRRIARAQAYLEQRKKEGKLLY